MHIGKASQILAVCSGVLLLVSLCVVFFFPHLFRPLVCAGVPSSLAIAGHSFAITVADTPESRQHGLSDTPSLDPDDAMLFVFPGSAVQEFWMKDMHYPLDIIWIDAERRIVGFADTARPESYPAAFRSPSPVRYVLETNAGVARALGVATGTRVTFGDCR